VLLSKWVGLNLSLLFITSVTLAKTSDIGDDIEDYFSMTIEELTEVEIEVATKNKKSLALSPSTVSVYTRREIDALGVSDLAALLNLVPGFQTYSMGWKSNNKAVSSRGRRGSLTSYEILVLYDGQRINAELSGSAFTENDQLSLANIKRVEIIRGPGSAIYGANAFTGIINLVTDQELNNLNVSLASFGHYSANLNYSGFEDEQSWSLFLSAFDRQGENLPVQGFSQMLNSKDQHHGVDFYGQYQLDNLSLKARYISRSADGFYTVERIDDEFNHHNQHQYHLLGDYDWQLSETLSANINGYYLNTAARTIFTSIPAGVLATLSQPPSTAPFRSDTSFSSTEMGFNIEAVWELADQHELLFGFSLRDSDNPETITGSNYDTEMLANNDFPITYYGELTFNTQLQKPLQRLIFGAFAQYDGKITDNLLLTTGIRYDHYSDFGSTLNPRLGLVYRANKAQTFKFSFGQAFRAPSPVETHLTNNNVMDGNLDLQPEKITTYELHWSQSFEQNNLALTLFKNKIVDAVALLPTLDADIQGSNKVSWLNADTFTNAGLELEGIAALNDDSYIRVAYTRFFDHPTAAKSQSDTLLSASFNHGFKLWNFNLSGFYHSDMTYTSSSTLEDINLSSSLVFNSKLSYQWSSRSTLSLTVSNLLDKTYLTPSATGFIQNGVVNNGRAFEFKMQYQF
jgi:iron complex outermembrane receptor protein